MTGEILFLAHRVPYPPDRGDKIRSWHMLRRIAAIAPTHVVALCDDPRDMAHLGVIENVAASVMIAPRKVTKAQAVARALLTGKPASVCAFSSGAVQTQVDHLLATRPIRTIFAYSGQMAQFIPRDLGGRRFVMDFVDMDSAKFSAYAQGTSGLSAWAQRGEGKRLFNFEKTVANRSTTSLFVSADEAALFREASGLGEDRVGFIENGIDLDVYDPAIARDSVITGKGPLIVFTGQMDYRPNVEAVEGFARNSLSMIRACHPQTRFAIVGRNPTQQVTALAKLPGVIVTGEVADTRDWLAAADVVVAPLKLARGIQNKVLEAMAMAKPVVVSPAAAQGIDARHERDFMIAQGPGLQADAVITLLDKPVLAHALGNAARAQMVARYSWDTRLAGLAGLLGFEANGPW